MCCVPGGPPADISHPWVRELTAADAELIRTADPYIPEHLPDAEDEPERIVFHGVSAGAIHDGRLVSVAASVAWTNTHAEIVVVTLDEFQNNGLATAPAVLVARRLRADNLIPQWRVGAPNIASSRVATKLGFVETRRRRYVVLDDVRAEWTCL
jgi:RimJ/RimL family protein N-acetyltransferase